MISYRASSGIRYEVVDDRVILIDLRSGEYYVFDERATEPWLWLLGDRSVSRDRLVELLEIDDGLLEAELEAIAVAHVAEGWLCRSPDNCGERAVARTTPNAAGKATPFAAWRSLLWTWWALRHSAFSKVYADCIKHSHRSIATDTQSTIEQAERSFATAERFFLLRQAPDDCLPRSIALYRFLRSAGIAANHHIGVTRFPFRAHAWVVAEGRVLFDDTSTVAAYAKLATL